MSIVKVSTAKSFKPVVAQTTTPKRAILRIPKANLFVIKKINASVCPLVTSCAKPVREIVASALVEVRVDKVSNKQAAIMQLFGS